MATTLDFTLDLFFLDFTTTLDLFHNGLLGGRILFYNLAIFGLDYVCRSHFLAISLDFASFFSDFFEGHTHFSQIDIDITMSVLNADTSRVYRNRKRLCAIKLGTH